MAIILQYVIVSSVRWQADIFVQALISELTDHSGKVEDLKNTLKQLITENPDSPEAETWKRQLEDIGQLTKWLRSFLNTVCLHKYSTSV